MLIVPTAAGYSYCADCVGLSSVSLVTPVPSHESLHMTRPALNVALLKFPSFTPTYIYTRSNVCVIDTCSQALRYLASTGDIPLRSRSVWLNLVNLHTGTYPPTHTPDLKACILTQYTTPKRLHFFQVTDCSLWLQFHEQCLVTLLRYLYVWTYCMYLHCVIVHIL